MKTDVIVVLITCSSKAEAGDIAALLLKKRLAACANVVDKISSNFWWKGRIEKADEALVMVKTRRKAFSAIEREVKRLHSYEVPEIIALPVIAGSKDYLGWVKESVILKLPKP